MADIMICRTEDFGSGSRIVSIDDLEIGVFRHGNHYVAYRNLCPHQGGPACEGVVVPCVTAVLDEDRSFRRNDFDRTDLHFVCPWHGYEFRMATGECVGDPKLRLNKYETFERDGNLYVSV